MNGRADKRNQSDYPVIAGQSGDNQADAEEVAFNETLKRMLKTPTMPRLNTENTPSIVLE